jgi:hypothetical protein
VILHDKTQQFIRLLVHAFGAPQPARMELDFSRVAARDGPAMVFSLRRRLHHRYFSHLAITVRGATSKPRRS